MAQEPLATPAPLPGGPPAAPPAAPPTAAEPGPPLSHDAENAVVKVFVSLRYPDFTRPWTKQAPVEATGSGVVIEGKRILTNAHVVGYASQIQIQGNQAGDKLSATVVAYAPDIDLALLKLDDTSFFDTHAPLPRATILPRIKDAVLAYGYPVGGNSLSITKGIVSRIEFVRYGIAVSALRVQIDAAINPGNSGGPALVADKMIGLANSGLRGGTQNIGYLIPDEEIEFFLKQVAAGHYSKPGMYDDLQTLENPALRPFLKLDASAHGMLVHEPAEYDSVLKQWDLISRIGETAVDDQGMVILEPDLRVDFRYLIQKTAKDGKVPLTVVRAGKTQELQVPVPSQRRLLIDSLRGDYPPYFIYGPLVFSPASQEQLASLFTNQKLAGVLSLIRSPLITHLVSTPDAEHEELVVVSAPLFPHKLSEGYSNPFGSVVSAVNGTHVKSLAHMVALLRDLKDEFVTFEFDQRGGETMVFSRKAIVAATDEILTDNGVRAQGSPELMKVWAQKH
jgi:S1-C subfamily serine protease